MKRIGLIVSLGISVSTVAVIVFWSYNHFVHIDSNMDAAQILALAPFSGCAVLLVAQTVKVSMTFYGYAVRRWRL